MGERRTIELFGWGPIARERWCDDGERRLVTFEVDQKFADDLIASFEAFSEYGSYPAILAEHDYFPVEIPGLVFGRVIRLFTTEKGISAEIEWAGEMHVMFDDGFIDQFSPGFEFFYPHPHEPGVVLAVVLHEVSFTSGKFLQNIGNASPHYSMSMFTGVDHFPPMRRGFIFSRDNKRSNMAGKEEKTPEITLSDEQLKKIAGHVHELSKTAPPVAAVTAAVAAPTAVSATDERIAGLERTNLDNALTLRFSGREVPEELRTQLYAMKYSAAVEMIKVIPVGTATPGQAPAGERGAQGQAAAPVVTPATGGIEFSKITETFTAAKTAGIKPGVELLRFARARGVDPAKVDGGDWGRAMTETFGG